MPITQPQGIPLNGYFYDKQVENYVLQFMAIFGGLQVQLGKYGSEDPQFITVPIYYGQPDRVVAAILAENVQNKPIRLPAMSAFIKGFNFAADKVHGLGQERRVTYTPVGGLVPNDTVVVHQLMPVPYDMDIELTIVSSNTDQQWQILEQIMPLFTPQLEIQTGDSPLDPSRINQVTLTAGPNMDNPNPIGTDKRILQCSMHFTVSIQISVPAQVKKDLVQKIYLRLGAVGASTSTMDIISELDAEGIPYQLIFDASNITI